MPAEQQIQYADQAQQQQPAEQTKLCYQCQSTLQDPAQSLYCSLCRPHTVVVAVPVPQDHPPPPPVHLQQQQQQQQQRQSSPARRTQAHGYDNGLLQQQQNNAAVQQAVGSDSHLPHTHHNPPAAPTHQHAHAPSTTPYSNNNSNNLNTTTTSCRKPTLVSLQCSNIASSSSSSSPTSTSASASGLYRHQQPHQLTSPFEEINASSLATPTSTLARSGTPGAATAQQPHHTQQQHQQQHIGASSFHCPDPLTDVTRLRIRTRAHHCLYPGATFQGTQKSGRNSYDVNVTIVDVNFPASTLCGYLRIRGLTDDWPELTTYFDAEIIGSRYGFLTQNWGATQHEDIVHWSRFPAFKHIRQEAVRPHMTLDERDRGVVFMRWKERFLVPDHRVQDINGASFAGFYYVCVDFNPPATPPSPNSGSGSDTHTHMSAGAAATAMDTDVESEEPNMPSTPESFGQNLDLDMDDEVEDADGEYMTSSSSASRSFYSSYQQRQRQYQQQHLQSPSPSPSPSSRRRRKPAGRSRTRRGGFSMGDEGVDGFVDDDDDDDEDEYEYEDGDDGEVGDGVFGFGGSHEGYGSGRMGRGSGRGRGRKSKRRGASLAPPGGLAVATMSGFYYHQNSEPYQQLSLAHVPEQTSSSFEFR